MTHESKISSALYGTNGTKPDGDPNNHENQQTFLTSQAAQIALKPAQIDRARRALHCAQNASNNKQP